MNNLVQGFQLTLLILMISTLTAQALIPWGIKLAMKLGFLDVPGTAAHKTHQSKTPLIGGLVFVLVLAVIFAVFGNQFSEANWKIFFVTLIIAGFGIYDDVKQLSARQKFLGQLIAAVVLLLLGVHVSIIKSSIGPFPAIAINSFLTIIWLVGVSNAFNLIDGADGLAISLGITSSLLMIAGATVALQMELTYQAAIILGALLTLLFYNLPPARLFIGDGGAQAIGFLLAALGILYNPAGPNQLSSWFVPITFFAIPIFDTCLVFFSRIRHGAPFYKADLNHTYHRLIRSGLSPIQSIWIMNFVAIIIGSTGLIALYTEPLWANSIFLVMLIVGVVAFFYLERWFLPRNQRGGARATPPKPRT